MVEQYPLFREYIHWRARMVVYVAAALVIFGVAGLVALVTSTPVNLTRFGLLMQMVGVLALAPDVIGKQRILRLVSPAPAADPAPAGIVERKALQFFSYYLRNNLPIALGNTFASAVFILLLVLRALRPGPELIPGEWLLHLALGLLGFTWLNLFMLAQIYRLIHTPPPDQVMAGFFSADLAVSLLSVIFAGLVYIIGVWGRRVVTALYSGRSRSSVRRVLLVITLPGFVVGLLLQILATFL